MGKKEIIEQLDALNRAIDTISDEALARLVNESGLTAETANRYAFIESQILSYDYSKAGLGDLSIGIDSDDYAMAA